MKLSVCLLTAYDSTQQPLAAFTVPSMQAFAQAHGYAVRAVYREDWERPRGWIKIGAITGCPKLHFLEAYGAIALGQRNSPTPAKA